MELVGFGALHFQLDTYYVSQPREPFGSVRYILSSFNPGVRRHRSSGMPGHLEVNRTPTSTFKILVIRVLLALALLPWGGLFCVLPFPAAPVGPLFVALMYIWTVVCAVGAWRHLDQLLHYRKRVGS